MSRLNPRTPEEMAAEVEAVGTDPDTDLTKDIAKLIRFDKTVSTGSTLLDLAISGNRIRGGGLPGGIIVEVFGPSGHGKTLVAVETCASVEFHGGNAEFDDPEGRLDLEYARLTNGLDLRAKGKYHRSKTVEDMFEHIKEWDEEEGSGEIDILVEDSLAALASDLEMEGEDKRGQAKAKAMSQGLRKNALNLANKKRILLCTNQIRQGSTPTGQAKEIVPGGEAFPFYASLRIRIGPPRMGKGSFKIEEKVKVFGKEQAQIIGVHPYAYIIKNTLDDPYKEVPLYVMNGRGLDDVRANLQWLKDTKGGTSYDCIYKTYSAMNNAIAYIEAEHLQGELRETTINAWMEIQQAFKDKLPRAPKMRF